MRQNPFSRSFAADGYATTLPGVPASTTVVHVLDIACPLARLREFMGDAQQWLPWAMPALQSVQPLPFGQWLLKTRRSLLKLRICPTTASNELHYEMVVPGLGSCQALVHVGTTPLGCQLRITLHKHQQLPMPAFATSARQAFSGLETLKQVLEQD
jgi:hypothetical protein